MTSIVMRDGSRQEVTLTLEDHREADAKGISFAAHINTKYDADPAYGSAFEQALQSNEIFMKPNKDFGIKAPTVAKILSENYDVNMGAINRGGDRDPFSPQGRLIFGSALLEIISNQLMEDNGSYEAVFNRLVAMNTSVDSPRWDQVELTTTAPMAARNQPIAQLATPASMINVTLASSSYRLPTRSIGIEISDEAQKSTTVDMLSLALKNQASAERAVNIDNAIYDMVMGSTDLGSTALSAVTSASFDSLSIVGGTFHHNSYIKFLRSQWKKLNIDWIVCDLNTFLILESRSGRPNYQNVNGTDGHLNSMMVAANPNIPDSVNYFIVEDTMLHDGGAYGSANHPLGGTRKVLGIDSSKAIRKVTYAGASYSALEAYVLRRSSAMRFDYSENFFRVYKNGDGFRLMQI